MNKYEDPTQRLHSHNWSEEYKENYEKVFGKKETWLERRAREEQRVTMKLSYTNGDVFNKTFATRKDADWFIQNEGDHLVAFVEIVPE